MRRVLTLALASAATLMIASPASASLVYDANPPVAISAQGFGNVPRDLTVQANGNSTNVNESGCVGVASGATITFHTCVNDALVHDHNGVTNVGGDEPPPNADNQKYGIPTTASLGITSASDIGILFNATDPGGDGVNLIDITLKFYSAAGILLGAIDGQQPFTATETGNGSAGFVFDVSSDELAYVNGILGNAGPIYMALEATIGDAESGPESFTIFNLHSPPVPEPATWAMMLLGFGGIGIAMRRRRAKSGGLLQIA